MKRFWKSKINQRLTKSASKIGLTLFTMAMILSITKIQGTNSSFMDTESVSGIEMAAGIWIPTLEMTVSGTPNSDGWYTKTPCVTLEASGLTIGTAEIYFEFSNDGNPVAGGTLYDDEACVPIPDGNPTHFQAQAVNSENSDWKSSVVSGQFKVKTAAVPGDVVINEVMWSGSTESNADEWIELRNMTAQAIDIGQWKIKNAMHAGGTDELIIPAGKSIPANGYFLIANYSKANSNSELDVDVDMVNNDLSLHDLGNGNLKLKNSDGTTIDEAKGNLWPAGWHGIYFHLSMERNNTPGDGLDGGSWHSCTDARCNDETYWDHESGNYGTPGSVNLSKNDITAEDYDPQYQPDVPGDEAVAPPEDLDEPPVPAGGENTNAADSALGGENAGPDATGKIDVDEKEITGTEKPEPEISADTIKKETQEPVIPKQEDESKKEEVKKEDADKPKDLKEDDKLQESEDEKDKKDPADGGKKEESVDKKDGEGSATTKKDNTEI